MIKPIKPEVFQMEISGYTQKFQKTSRYIIAELYYDDGEKKTFSMGGSRLDKKAINQFIDFVFTRTHEHGKASGIEAFLDALAIKYLKVNYFNHG